MKKILPFIIVVIFLFPNINGINERTNKIFNKIIPFNFHNIFSFIFSIIFSNFKEKINSWNTASLNDDELDQEQPYSDSSYKIYGSYWAAQSFKPHKDKLTRVQILMNRTEKKKSFDSRLANPIHKNIDGHGKGLGYLKKKIGLTRNVKTNPYVLDKVGDITLSIRKTLTGKDLTMKTLHPDEIRENTYAYWVEFDFPDIEVECGETYFIVVHATGGEDNNRKSFYNWRYKSSDRYRDGKAYVSSDGGRSWTMESYWDFAFKTYGSLVGEEPDGVVDRWAVIVGVEHYQNRDRAWFAANDAYDMKNVLINHGWNPNHIELLIDNEATEDAIRSKIQWMDDMDDGDDICLFFFSGHGGHGVVCTYEGTLSGRELDRELDKLGSDGIAVIFDTCYSGSMESWLAQSGRVILMSSKSNEYSWPYGGEIQNGIFVYFLVEGLEGNADVNNDKVVSAEEAFYYAEAKTIEFEENNPPPEGAIQHPQIYDGYPGELKITQV